MNIINYFTKHPKLIQFSVVLIVFFILVSMTGEYHDLIIERDSFIKDVNNGSIEDSVGFLESIRMIFSWKLPPQLVRLPEISFWNPSVSTAPVYWFISIIITFILLFKSAILGNDKNILAIKGKSDFYNRCKNLNIKKWFFYNWTKIFSKFLLGIIVGLILIPTLYSWIFGEITTSTFWEIPSLIHEFAQYLMFDFMLVEHYNPRTREYDEWGIIRVITRGIGDSIQFVITLVREILMGGFKSIVSLADVFSSQSGWDWIRDNKGSWYSNIPALPWTVLTTGVFILGYKLKGLGLSMLAGFGCIYLLLFGQWEPSMETLSFILVAAPISGIIGVIFGVIAYKSKAFENVLTPLLNIAQTMPHFSYLVPVIVFFGLGDHAGAIATIIFATPPMIRLTLLGLKRVPPEVIEAGMMSGCKKYQLLFKVLIPTARHDIIIGVNQVIMQCLAMVVIASLIGAKGLGSDLLASLNQLRIGRALEIGFCIVVIAVVLDRLSLAWANKQKDYFNDASFFKRHKTSILFVIIFFFACILSWFGNNLVGTSAFNYIDQLINVIRAGFSSTFNVTLAPIKTGVTNYFSLIPYNMGITTEPFWQGGVNWMVENWQIGIKTFNKFFLENMLMPMKATFLAMPVVATFVLFMGVAYIVGGIRSALVVGGFLSFIALTEWWERALITMYMTTFAVIVSVFLGVIVGALCAQNKRATKFILLICDTFQVLPSFIYLIPVIMLFGINDTAVLIAVIIYAIIPPIRYTLEGLRSVPASLIDAGNMAGANKLQRIINIDFPLAFPHIVLGVSQCVIFALFMVIIGAFIGTDDLGQFILKALSDKKGIGNGLILGLCVAFIGLTVDHLISTWSKKRKQELGID